MASVAEGASAAAALGECEALLVVEMLSLVCWAVEQPQPEPPAIAAAAVEAAGVEVAAAAAAAAAVGAAAPVDAERRQGPVADHLAPQLQGV